MLKKSIFIICLFFISVISFAFTESVSFPLLVHKNIDYLNIELEYIPLELYEKIGRDANNYSTEFYSKIIDDNNNIDYVKYYDKYILNFDISEPELIFDESTILYKVKAKINILTEKPIYDNEQKFNIVGGKLISYIGNSNTVKIPEEVEIIGADCFSNRSEITEVILPDGIKKIEYGAFYNCINLTDINLPDSLNEIGEAAFMGCVSLKKINIPKSLSKISAYSFNSCGIRELTVPENIIEIDKCAFAYLYKLEKLNLNEGLKNIGFIAFGNSNINSLVIPDSVKKIEPFAFQTCGIKEMKLGSGLTKIDTGVFFNNSFIKLTIPGNIKEIGSDAFCKSCNETESIILEKGIEKINAGAFSSNENNVRLKEISIPDGIDFIGFPFSFKNIDTVIGSKETIDFENVFMYKPKNIIYR